MMRLRPVLLLVCLLFMIGAWPVLAQDDAPPLVQTYTSCRGRLTFQYPEDWAVAPQWNVDPLCENGAIYTGVATASDAQMPAGSAEMKFTVLPLAAVQATLQLERAVTPVDFLNYVAASVSGQSAFEAGDIVPLTVGGRPAAYLDAEYDTAAQHEDARLLVVHVTDDVGVLLTLRAADGERALWRSMLLALAATLAFDPDASPSPDTALARTFASDDGQVRFAYPANWSVEFVNTANGIQFVTVGNRFFEGGSPAQHLEAGQAALAVVVLPVASTLANQMPPPTTDPQAWLNYIVASLTNDSAYTEAVPFDVDGREAVRTDLVVTEAMRANGQQEDGRLMVVRLSDEAVAWVSLITLAGDLERWMPTVLDIMATIEYDAASATEEATVEAA